MTKKRNITLVIIVLILILVVILILTNPNKQKDMVVQGDVTSYNLFRCMSDIPAQFDETLQRNVPIRKFLDLCNKEYFIPSEYERISSGTLLKDKNLKECINTFGKTRDYLSYNECIKQTLPKLKEKYPHIIPFLKNQE